MTQKYIKMVETLLLTVLIIAISIFMLSIRVIIKKNGRFSAHDVGESQAMRERGINCTLEQDKESRMKGKAF